MSAQAQKEPIEGKLVQQHDTGARGIASTTTPSDLLRMAVEQGADLDRLERLMDLQDRWETNEARKAFTVALTGFKSEPVEILKRKNVSFANSKGEVTSYNHAELSDITEAIGPALAKHDLSYRWNVIQADGVIKVNCVLTHIRGHSETVTMQAAADSSGGKNAIQSIASAVTYLQRYTVLAITGMSTKGMDDDGQGGNVEPEFDSREADWKSAIEAAESVEALKALASDIAKQDFPQDARDRIRAAYNARGAKLKKAAQ